jgi:hypothetical protein
MTAPRIGRFLLVQQIFFCLQLTPSINVQYVARTARAVREYVPSIWLALIETAAHKRIASYCNCGNKKA